MRYLSLFSGIEAATVAWEALGFEPVAFAEFEDFPKAVLAHHYPSVPDLGDVTKITEEQIIALGPFDVLVGGSPCFVAGTMVLTMDGYKPIEDVQVGDLVYTHLHNWKPVVRIGNKVADTITVKSQGFIDTITTSNHPFYCRKRKWVYGHRTVSKTFLQADWKEAGNLDYGDFLGLPIIQDTENPENLDEKTCWLLGRYIADGHYRNESRGDSETHRQYQLIISVGKDKVEEFESCMQGVSFSLYPHSKSVYRAVFSSKYLVELVERLGIGKGALNKQIPIALLRLPTNLLKAVLDGYMSGDGCTIKNKHQITTVSKKLALSFSLAVAKVYRLNTNIGLYKVDSTSVICGRTVNQHDVYTCRFVDDTATKRTAHIDSDNQIVWSMYRKQKNTGKRVVYNIEVADDHSYTANNYIVHNCQDLSVAGKRAGMRHDDGSTTRSGLFDEQVRIFEIARKHNGCRYLIWENVPGAFSSNGGDDFAYVLGAMVGRSVHTPPDGWKNSGICLSEDGSRIAEWRVLDAQYFGVPQRRRRIFIVLDTGAWWSRSPILSEQDCMSGHIAQGGDEGEGASEGVEGSVGESCYAVRTAQTGANGIGIANEKSHTLDRANGKTIAIATKQLSQNISVDKANPLCANDYKEPQAIIYENHAQDSRVTESVGVCPTLHSQMGTGGGQRPFCADPSAEVSGGGDIPRQGRHAYGEGLQGNREDGYMEQDSRNPRIASGKDKFPTLCANAGSKQWLGNQEALSGDYHILEDT